MKKRSAASFPRKRPSPPTFFIDRSLGNKVVAEALRAIGCDVRIHDDLFPSDTQDSVWLAEVGRRDWIVLTKDKRIRHRKLETEALLTAKVGAFVLTAGDLSGEEMGAIFAAAVPAMTQFASRVQRPFIVTLSRGGRLKRVDAA